MVLHDLHDTSTFTYNGSQIIGIMAREHSKIAKNLKTSKTNRIHEAQVLAQYTKNDEDTKFCGKASPGQ